MAKKSNYDKYIGFKGENFEVVGFDYDRYEDKNRKEQFWLCKCTCGNIISRSTKSIQGGNVNCGCITKEKIGIANSKVRGMSFEGWAIENNKTDFIELWDYDLNDKPPSDVSFSSGKRIFFKCKNNKHDSHAHILSDVTSNKMKSIECPYCNSVGQWIADEYGDENVSKYWGTSNKGDAFSYAKKSHSKIYIKCQSNESHGEYAVACSDFTSGRGCPICSNKQIAKGVNDVATTHPHLVKYFLDKQEAYTVGAGSSKVIKLACERCGSIKNTKLTYVTKRGFSCPVCGDGKSYPEKLVANILKHIGVDFKQEVTKTTFDWCGDSRYDFYIPSLSTIIETHGEQHYNGRFSNYVGGRTLEEEQENDRMKRKLALANGIERYIVLDCRNAELGWIRDNILNSELPSLLNFNQCDIDWNECEITARGSSIAGECWKLWNDGKSIVDISDMIGTTKNTVVKYLKVGVSIGKCNYDKDEALCRGNENKRLTTKRVIDVDTGMIFESARELERVSEEIYGEKIGYKQISKVCNGHNKTCRGHVFKLYDEYINK